MGRGRKTLEINKIYNKDCLDLMSEMPDNFIDLVVTSPPYSSLREYKGFTFPFKKIARELYRVVKENGVVVWVVGDAADKSGESGTSFRQALYFKKIGFNLHDTMIYNKASCQYPDSTRYYQSFEYMFILSKNGMPKTFNPIKDRKNKHLKKDKIWARQINGTIEKRERYTKNSSIFGVRYNVWKIFPGYLKSTQDKFAFDHPAMFPEILAHDCIVSWSNMWDLVYDPFMGSGTTAKIAKFLGRKFIGSEISEEYCRIAEKRLLSDNFNVIINKSSSGNLLKFFGKEEK